ncbi:MAG: hypothetical protein ABI474_06805 [Actinomycetota bacterium]
MRYARRFIAAATATVIGLASWSVAAATVAYAQMLPDPDVVGDFNPPPPPHSPLGSGTQLWKFVLAAAIAAMLTVAVVGLVTSIRHQRSSQPSGMLHA